MITKKHLLSILSLVVLIAFLGCETKTEARDILLGENQVLYYFSFVEADEKLVSEWIEPHLVSLTGKHLKTINQRGVSGRSFEVMRVVEFDKHKSSKDIEMENKKVLDSLRKKIEFNLKIRIGM